MDENNKNLPDEAAEASDEIITRKMSVGEWAANVWYHYKWHILASIFIIVVIAVCVTQCVKKSEEMPDIHIVYAGSETLSKATDSKTGEAPFTRLESALESLIGDYNGDGKRIVDLEGYLWLSSSQLDALEAANAGLPKKDQLDVLAYAEQTRNNKVSIDNLMMQSDFYVWLVSEDLYKTLLQSSDGSARFATLADLGTENTPYYTDASGNTDYRAVRIKDLYAGSLDGFSALPDDTLLLLRAPTLLDGDGGDAYSAAKDFIRKLLKMG